jgi:hypothetical protein
MIRGAFTAPFNGSALCQIEAIKVHHFGPSCYEVVQELLQGVRTSVDFCQGPELGVRSED